MRNRRGACIISAFFFSNQRAGSKGGERTGTRISARSLSLYSLLFSVRSICGDLDVGVGWRKEEAASVQRGHSSLSRSCAAVLCQF